MTLKIGARQLAALTATGNHNFEPTVHGEVENLFDGDVAGALVFGTQALTNGTASGIRFALGMRDASNEACLSVSGDDAVTTSNWACRLDNTKALQFRDPTTPSTLAEADGSIIDTGLNLAWTTADIARRISTLIFGGASVEVDVVQTAFVGGGAETLTVNHGLSGAPDAVIALLHGATINTNLGQGRFSIGFMARTAGTYVSLLGSRTDNQTTEFASAILLTDCVAGRIASGAAATVDYKVTLDNFTSSAFDAVTDANASTNGIVFFLLKFPNAAVATGTVDLPNNTNEFTVHSGLAKKPKCILTLTSMLTAVGTGATNDTAGWFGLGSAFLNNGSIEQLCVGGSTDDAATGTNALANKSMTHARWVETLDVTGAVALAGDIMAFTADGATARLTTAPASAVKAGYIIFGDEDAAPVLDSVDPDPLVEGTAATLAGSNFAATGNTVAWGPQALTVDTEGVTEIVTTAVSVGDQVYGEALDLIANDGTDDSNAVSVSMEPASGERYYNLSGGVNTDTAIRFTSVPDLNDNAQIHVTEVRDSTATPIDLALFEILPDGTPQIDGSVVLAPGDEVEVDCRANNRDGEGWGAGETVTLTVILGAVIAAQSDGYAVTLTPAVDGLIRAVAVRRHTTAPNAAQLAAGTDGDDNTTDAVGSVTGVEGIETNLTLSGLTLPKHDLYVLDAQGSVSAFLDQLKSAPAGRQYVEVAL